MPEKMLPFLLVLSFSLFCISCDPPEDYELSEPGDYTGCYFDTNLESSAYRSAFIAYPCETSDGPFPALTFTGGITNVKEQMAWLADHVVTYGVILIVMTPTNNISMTTDVWKKAMLGGLEMLESENNRPSSPIYHLVDMSRLGIMGFSMGGGGTLKAADTVGEKIKTALSLAPHESRVNPSMYNNISVPTLVTTGTNDSICPRDSVRAIFDCLPNDIERLFVNFTNANHVDWMNVLGDKTTQDRFKTFIVSWLKYYLAGDSSFKTYLSGEMHDKQIAAGWFTEYDYY
ncbi:MAG: dienelactone hydrolase family protein [Desulfobacteraceae bacterium]